MSKPESKSSQALTRILSIKEAADILGRPVPTLRYWRATGKGPRVVKTEGRIGYDEADLRAYIDANRGAVTSVRASIGG
jgi:predicted DNA-binding transcriptional regulator AlpA